MTGDIPKVGEGSKFASQLWLEDITKAGGLEVGGKKYPVELVIEDNESKAESAVKANTKMITEDEVLVIVGPQASKQAVPAGEVANNYKTPMISSLVHQPGLHQGPSLCFPRLLPGPVPGPGAGQFRDQGVRLQESRGAL
jgi:branched-chain amino acid transport system substrate-binding protein